MISYLAKRFLGAIPIMFGVAIIVFFLFNVVGGDPALLILGKHASSEQLADIRETLGLNAPLWKQFLNYCSEILRMDFGRSIATRQRISEMIWNGLGPTLSFAVPAFILTFILSMSLSLIVAYFRGKWIDRLGVVFCVMGMSVPALAYILFGQYVMAFKMGWFPISGFDYDIFGRIHYLVLPILIWIVLSMGYDVRFYRTALVEEMHQDYVRTARAKGLSEPTIFFKHVLKNALVSVTTYVIWEIPGLLLGTFLLEGFFGIPGIGNLTIDALNTSDLPVVKAMATIVSFVYIGFNILTDLIYVYVDPRVKLT